MKELLRQILRTLGVTHIYEASDGAEGFEMFRQFVPDIIMLDWQMAPIVSLDVGAGWLLTGDFFRVAPDGPPPADLYMLYARWQLEF